MSRVALGVVTGVVLASSVAACTVDLDSKQFCEPGCSTSSSGGSGGTGGATTSSSSTGGSGGTGGEAGSGGEGGCGGKAVTATPDDFTEQGRAPEKFWTPLFAERSLPAMVQNKEELVISPIAGATWFTGSPCPEGKCGAPAVVQRLAGNFSVKTHARVMLRQGAQPEPFSAAGILLADPCDPEKNNVVWDIGHQDNGAGTDLYQTKDGAAQAPIVKPALDVEADLYACRIGSAYYFYVSSEAGVMPVPGSPDQVLTGTDADLDVGLTVHLNGKNPVLEGHFTGVTFGTPATQDDCLKGL